MSGSLRAALFSALAAFLVSSSYPAAIIFCLPKSTRPARWIQNNPSYSVFLLSSFPAAVFVFSATLNWDVISYWLSSWRAAVFCLSVILSVLMVSLTVLNDFTSKPIAPYVLKSAQAETSSLLEFELRTVNRSGGVRYRLLEPQRKRYQGLVHLASIRDVFTRGGPVAYVHIVLAWITTLFVIAYFWYLAFVLIKTADDGINLPEREKEKLVLIFILLVSWFPMRLHTEWYQNEFHRPQWLRQYSAFWMLAFLAFAYLLFVILILKPKGTIFLVVAALMQALLAAVGKFKPDWLRSIGYFVSSLPFVYFVAIYLVFLVIVCATTAIWLMR